MWLFDGRVVCVSGADDSKHLLTQYNITKKLLSLPRWERGLTMLTAHTEKGSYHVHLRKVWGQSSGDTKNNLDPLTQGEEYLQLQWFYNVDPQHSEFFLVIWTD